MVAVRLGRPDDLVDGLDDVRRQHRATLRERFLDPLVLGDLEKQNREALVAERMHAGFVGSVRQGRNLGLEGCGLAAIHDSAISIDDLGRHPRNDFSDAAPDGRLRAQSGLAREGRVDLDEHEIDRLANCITDNPADEEALADVPEKLAALDFADGSPCVDVLHRDLRSCTPASRAEPAAPAGKRSCGELVPTSARQRLVLFTFL